MSVFSKIYHLRTLLTAALLLPLLCACSFYDYADNAETPVSPADSTIKYINLSIVVSAGNEGTTRADQQPEGGENGDGREAGSERENKVTGITLMLYQDDKGINTDADTQIAFIKYFPVTKVEKREEAGTDYPKEKRDEVVYTTDDQPIGSSLDLEKTYHAIVIANQNLESKYPVGSKVKDIRDEVVSSIYTGTGIGVNATNFIMALEEDCKIDFSKDPELKGNKLIYTVEDPIRIERLAARIDFWMKGATYNSAYDTPGYEYKVTEPDGITSSNDKFVLTAVMPFNLYNDNAKEYLFKRVNEGNGTITYLKDEYSIGQTIDPFVIDPKTKDKSGQPSTILYDNPLDDLVSLQTVDNKTTFADEESVEKYYQSTKALRDNSNQKVSFKGDESKDNFILCYPKENTLKLASELYYYATGVAIEGDYYHYTNGTYEIKHLVYYGYLRHQGEPYEEGETTYSIKTAEELSQEQTAAGSQSTAMNFGVVRNNIYRISIDKITEKGEEPPEVTWKIMVKNWDVFTHKTIFM